MARRDNGEGTLFKRGDGRWCAKINVTLPDGSVKRVSIVKKDRAAVKAQLEEWRERNKKRLPTSEENWTVGAYITHWLDDIMPGKIRLSTRLRYKNLVYGYVVPSIGKILLKDLGVHNLQTAIDNLVRQGVSSNTILKFKRTLSSCLTYAMRKEIIFRNVAKLATHPTYTRKKIVPWTSEQAKMFLRETRGHAYHLAYMMMLTYGIRKGEMLGLRWSDIDFVSDKIYIRQQIYRLAGAIRVGEVKTEAGRRTLPLIPDIKKELLKKAKKDGIAIPDFDSVGTISMDGLIVTSSKGTVIEPGNLNRSFYIYLDKLGLPRITIHTLRHTAATLLKNMGVPVKDAQLILGHSSISTTLAVYQHGDEATQKTALQAIGAALSSN